jgi:ribosomal-protein-alanine N-acetyltransferase
MSDSSESILVPEVSVRPATADDLDPIVAIESRVHLAPWTKQNFESEWEKPYSITWVLTDDETDTQVFAYVTFWVMDDTVEILNIAVDLPHRGLGFAKLLLQQVIKEGVRRSAKRLILDVRKSNLPAVGLYQRAGFGITQYRKGFYSNGEDAYHMSLALEGDDIAF